MADAGVVFLIGLSIGAALVFGGILLWQWRYDKEMEKLREKP